MHPKQRLFSLLAGLVIVLAAIGYFLRRADTPEPPPQTAQEQNEPEPAAPAPEPPRRAPAPPAPPYKEERVTSDGLPIMPAHDDDPRPDGPVHPHPITPQHVRIYAENRLIGALNGAMDVKDAPGMRRLLEQYRREYPEDDNQLQDGYAVIADCFERPSATTRQAAARWIESHNGSTLKRFVNRHCLD